MAAITKKKGPLLDPGLCRCCRNIKKCRILTADYYFEERKEVYSDMFMDCFGLLLSHLEGDEKDICICASCVVRLRDACTFKQQVLQCEQMFINTKLDTKLDESTMDSFVKGEPFDGLGNGLEDVTMVDILADSLDFCYPDTKIQVTNENEDRTAKETGDKVMKKELSSEIQKLKRKLDKMLQRPGTNTSNNKARPLFYDVPKIEANMVKVESMERVEPRAVSDRLNEDSNSSDSAPLINSVRPRARNLVKKNNKKCDNDRKLVANKPAIKRQLIRKTPIPAKLKKSEENEQEKMSYMNAVAVIENSFVCPFHNRISIYYCYYCRDQFTNPVELREHTMTHTPQDLFDLMMEYKKAPKIDITRIDCRLCPMKIDDLEILKSHLKNFHGITIYPVKTDFLTFRLTMHDLACTACGAKFPYFDVLKKHMIEHFGKYVCDICGACFLEQPSLRTHLKSHNKREVFFPCEVCGKNLKSKYSKDMHVATVHEKKATVNCYKCESSFLSHALRNRHLIEAHGDKRTFPCAFCDKVYNRRKTLMEHNRRNHLKVYRHECELCDQKFYLPSRLKEHMATHTGERKFRCDFCDKSYPRLQSLQEHLRSHNSDKRFKCVLCNATFTQNGSLKNHMKSHHHSYEMPVEFPS